MFSTLLLVMTINLTLGENTFYRVLSGISFLSSLIICTLPWIEIFNELGLSFVSLFLEILSRGFCPLAQVTTNTFLLGLKTFSLGSVNPPFVEMCTENGLFKNQPPLMPIVYLYVFGVLYILSLLSKLFCNWIRPNTGKCDGNCAYGKALQNLSHQLNEMKNK